jgi:hypothetical protein
MWALLLCLRGTTGSSHWNFCQAVDWENRKLIIIKGSLVILICSGLSVLFCSVAAEGGIGSPPPARLRARSSRCRLPSWFLPGARRWPRVECPRPSSAPAACKGSSLAVLPPEFGRRPPGQQVVVVVRLLARCSADCLARVCCVIVTNGVLNFSSAESRAARLARIDVKLRL